MSNDKTPVPTRGVPVMLDKERRLRYSFKTRRAMIEDLGGEEKLTDGLSGDALCKVLWYGLKWEDPELTVDDIEEAVDLENLDVVVTAMSKALGYKGKAKVQVDDANPPVAAAPSAS